MYCSRKRIMLCYVKQYNEQAHVYQCMQEAELESNALRTLVSFNKIISFIKLWFYFNENSSQTSEDGIFTSGFR